MFKLKFLLRVQLYTLDVLKHEKHKYMCKWHAILKECKNWPEKYLIIIATTHVSYS